MSNHFPSVPGSFNLASITYSADWNDLGLNGFSSLTYFDVEGVVPLEENAGTEGLFSNQPETESVEVQIAVMPFVFNTAGDAGSFDQDTAEGQIATILNGLAQAVATATGQTLADIQVQITVSRSWAWEDADSEGFVLTYGDTMTYPAE